jgi:hypothetical protein
MTEIRIVSRTLVMPGLFEDQAYTVYSLVDADEQPIAAPLCATLPEAERQCREMLAIVLTVIAQDYEEQEREEGE